jgi:aspartokinase-like uncharacterized kinase
MNQAIALMESIKDMNKSADDEFGLSEDLDHWISLGVTTREQLCEYLNDRQDGRRMWTTTNNV